MHLFKRLSVLRSVKKHSEIKFRGVETFFNVNCLLNVFSPSDYNQHWLPKGNFYLFVLKYFFLCTLDCHLENVIFFPLIWK